MKYPHVAAALAAFVVVAAGPVSASTGTPANTATLTFQGRVTAATCNIDVTASAVTLEAAQVQNLKTAGDTDKQKPIAIVLNGCSDDGKVKLHLLNTSPAVAASGRLSNTEVVDPAQNVSLELIDLSGGGTPINLKTGTGDLPNASFSTGELDIVSGHFSSNSLLAVRYHADGAATAGGVKSELMVMVSYL